MQMHTAVGVSMSMRVNQAGVAQQCFVAENILRCPQSNDASPLQNDAEVSYVRDDIQIMGGYHQGFRPAAPTDQGVEQPVLAFRI